MAYKSPFLTPNPTGSTVPEMPTPQWDSTGHWIRPTLPALAPVPMTPTPTPTPTPYATTMPVPDVRMPGGSTFNESGGPVPLPAMPTPVTAQPVAPTPLPPYMNTNPSFDDIRKLLATSPGTSPETKAILDNIAKQQEINRLKGVSDAQALAAQYGRGGSTTEQFGVQQAGAEADKAALDAQTKVYQDELARRDAARNLLAGYTSDEIASQRNALSNEENLALQKLLGEQGLAAAQANVDAERDLAKKTAKQQLLNTLIGAGASLGGAAITGKLLAGAGTKALTAAGTTAATTAASAGIPAATGAGVGGIPLASAANATPAAGGMGVGTMALSGAAGLGGWYAANKVSPATQEGDQGAMNVGGAIGGVGGTIVGGPAGAAAGAAAGALVGKGYNRAVEGVEKSLGGTAGSIARYSNPMTGIPAAYNKTKEAVSKVFGGGKNKEVNTTGGAGSYGEGTVVDALAQLRALKAQYAAGQLSKAQYAAAIDPLVQQAATDTGKIAGTGSKAANVVNPIWKQIQNEGFAKAVNGKWVALA